MPDTSTILSLPLILPSQAQKHVTHNEALRLLDVMVQLAVKSRVVATPPGSAVAGDRYIVPVGATGLWAGQAGRVALYEASAWSFFAPMTGWQAWVEDETGSVGFDGVGWVAAGGGPLSVTQFGVNATADTTNRLTVAAAATLLTHTGLGHQLKINKATTGNTASLAFQTGFSSRAELGTLASDDFTLRVSTDGSSFLNALTVDSLNGYVSLPQGVLSNGLTLLDATDTSKRAGFSLSGLSAGATRTYSLPNANTELAGLAGTQTFTGAKTFAGAVTFGGATVTYAGSVTSIVAGAASVTANYLGLGGAVGDAVNPLSVNAAATLLNHAGGGHQLKLNKASDADTASLTFQTGFSGRAEMGTTGSDDFAIKVSPDGSAFFTALTVARATGQATLPQALRLGGQALDPASPVNGMVWLNSTSGEVKVRTAGTTQVVGAGGGGVSDGDKGDVTVSGGGTVWALAASAKYGVQVALNQQSFFN